jgi:hypothetical protein
LTLDISQKILERAIWFNTATSTTKRVGIIPCYQL